MTSPAATPPSAPAAMPPERKPAILMAISNFHPTIGGSERQALLLSQTLAGRGWNVQVLTHALPGQPREETIGGVRVHRRVRGVGVWWIYRITYILSWIRHMTALRRTYDVIHCHQIFYHGLAGALMKKWWGKGLLIKCVSSGDYGDATLMRRKPLGGLTLRLARRHARMLCIARATARELKAAGFDESRLTLIPNGVDTRRFTPGPESLRDGNNILYVGRFNEVKNLPVLLDAFCRLLAVQPRLMLTLIGAGEGRERVDQIVASDELLSRRVQVLSDESELLPFYQRCGVFVLPSRVEGLSNALLEAMACGCPAVATAVGGNLDLLDPEAAVSPGLPEPGPAFVQTPHGGLVRPGDAKAFAEAVSLMLDNKEGRAACGRRAREFIERHYDVQSVIERLEAVYRDQAEVRD